MIDESLVELKNLVAKTLASINVDSYHLERADERLNKYAKSCIANTDDHNLYELLALSRFFAFLDKYDFRISEIKAFIVCYERLKFSGTSGRRRYKLTPIQVFQFTNILGFYHVGSNRRVIREALLFVPRKFSKTTSVSALSVYDLLFGDSNAQSYVAANSYSQAQICFGEISGVLKALDPKLRRFKINREIIFNKMKGKSSFSRCLASKADTLDGLNASMVIVDEFAQADSAALKNVLTSSMGARLNPLTVVITTASDKHTTPFVEMLNIYKAILRGEHENDSIFAHIFQPDEGDEEGDPHTWYKVHPHLGVIVYEDFYQQEYQKALVSAPDALEFRTKMLNIFASDATKTWLSAEEIAALSQKIDIRKIQGRPPCMCAVDLSICDDFSAVTYTIYSETLRKFHVYTDYYFPKGALKDHPNRELYERWAEQGYLILCAGDVIDYQHIVNDILSRNKYLCILGIGYDPYRSVEFVNMLSAAGAAKVLSPVKQVYSTFTSPVESFELAVKTGKVSFDDNPINWYCFANAVLDEDRNENRKPIKKTHNAKIDGVITALMTFWLFNNVERT